MSSLKGYIIYRYTGAKMINRLEIRLLYIGRRDLHLFIFISNVFKRYHSSLYSFPTILNILYCVHVYIVYSISTFKPQPRTTALTAFSAGDAVTSFILLCKHAALSCWLAAGAT